jgi:protocadherin-15
MVVIPRYEPVFVEPNLKEYETQVLQMSMAIDDNGSADLKMDFSARNPMFNSFNLDSVSYITHETSASSKQRRIWIIVNNLPVLQAPLQQVTRSSRRATPPSAARSLTGPWQGDPPTGPGLDTAPATPSSQPLSSSPL